ncbi:MAG: exosortase/archaeosortase family protein [Candidatus Micrarchaeota archaeon]|nr:exosortase/archaeosortase family protein [Candidatus Micrarchaeota archaeon]
MLFEDKNRVALLFLVASIAILLVNSFLITSQSIDNAAPTSYAIVVILMLPFFAAFAFKEKLEIKLHHHDIIAGVGLFAIFIFLIIGAQLAFPYLFLSYRMDMLILPIAIAAVVAILFGRGNLRKFWALILYPILASPLFFLPLLNLNNAFAQVNTIFVYGILHLVAPSVTYLPPFTIGTTLYTIGIGTACAGVAVFIALVLLLLPVAYLLDGKLSSKIYWLASGLALLLLLNFARMASIAAVWLLYGPNGAVGFVHGVAGILLFYLSIMVMVLLAKRYSLGFPRWKEREMKAKRAKAYQNGSRLLAIALSLGYLLISLNYSSQIVVPPQLSATSSYNFTPQSLNAFAGSFRGAQGWEFSAPINQTSLGGVLLLSNRTFNSTSPIILLVSSPNQAITNYLLDGTGIVAKYNFVDQSFIVGTVYQLSSANTTFYLMAKSAAYLFPDNQYRIVTTYLLMPSRAGGLAQGCEYHGFYTSVDNLLLGQAVNQSEMRQLRSAFCVSANFV